jgi:hypothetical protein
MFFEIWRRADTRPMHPRPSRKRSQTIQKMQDTKGCGRHATIARTHDAHWSPTHASTSSLFGQEDLCQHYRLLLLAPGALLMLDVSGARYCSSCQVLPSSLWLSFPCRVRHARLVRHQAAFLSHLKFCSLVILSSSLSTQCSLRLHYMPMVLLPFAIDHYN